MAGTMIGTGVGTLAGHPFSGMMIGGGIGMLVDSQPSRSQGCCQRTTSVVDDVPHLVDYVH